jgi:hypothetical protein
METAMNITLFELAAEYRSVADQLADMDLDPQTVADTLESISGDLESKATNVAAFVRNLESSAAAIKEAEAAMSARRKAIENRAASVRQYLLDNMTRTGITKIECPYFKIAVRTNPESVVIDDETAVPDDYLREIPARYEPDKSAMKSAMQDGFAIPGARLVRTQRVDIK